MAGERIEELKKRVEEQCRTLGSLASSIEGEDRFGQLLRQVEGQRAAERYYSTEEAKPYFPRGGIHCGNCLIDGEVKFRSWRMAVELKSDKDDILHGLGQLLEALAHDYDMALLVTSQSRLKGLTLMFFRQAALG
jgi:hypothetical protein